MISVLQLGTIDYTTGLTLQQQLVSLRKEEQIPDVLLLLEHKPVITLGRNAKAANVVASPELLSQRGVELFECDRGGDVTFHGPGQLVGYPIFDLRGHASGAEKDYGATDYGAAHAPVRWGSTSSAARNHLGAVDFIRCLEEVLIRTSADFRIETKRIPGLTGVWTNPDPLSSRAEQDDSKNRSAQSRACPEQPTAGRASNGDLLLADATTNAEAKLAAIGIHISRFVTSHGFALNVNTDLTCFNLIIPCGITTKPVTSMQQQLGKPLDMNAVAESIARSFGKVFSSQMLWVESLDALLGNTVGVPVKPPAELRQLHREDDTTWA